MFENIKMIITDVDGVLTDGGMYYDHDGLAFKKFHTRDASAIHRLREASIFVVALTSANDMITRRRIGDMHFDDSIFNCDNKARAVRQLSDKFNIPLDKIAYIGDDYIDLEAMRIVGVSVAPSDALHIIQETATVILDAHGGSGVLGYIVDYVLNEVKEEQPSIPLEGELYFAMQKHRITLSEVKDE